MTNIAINVIDARINTYRNKIKNENFNHDEMRFAIEALEYVKASILKIEGDMHERR